jgi:O-antigen/teichoic acid export membrane protein
MATAEQTTRVNLPQQSASASANGAMAQHRMRRLLSAWVTSIPSKGITLLVQVIAIPTVYRAIGPVQFAAYAAVTSAVSILGYLNLGMGGALVTPLAQAAAEGDHKREARLFSSTLVPIATLVSLALCIILPLILTLPLKLLFGVAASTTSSQALRTAALIACIGTLAAVPLSVVDSARQAYQEMHISNLFGTVSNALLCAGLLSVAWAAPTLPAFVAVTALLPLVIRVFNGALLLVKRPYLLAILPGLESGRLMRKLAADGVRYIGGSALATGLWYQWPIYYMTRVRFPIESSTFALCMQLVFLALNFGATLAQPLWPAVADAFSRTDSAWVRKAARRARLVALGYGACGLLAFGFGMNLLLRLWLHRSIYIQTAGCWLAGTCVLLSIWEYIHWPILLGMGKMRAASNLVLLRSAAFALFVPWATRYGLPGIMILLCASMAFISAWGYPRILSRTLENAD